MLFQFACENFSIHLFIFFSMFLLLWPLIMMCFHIFIMAHFQYDLNSSRFSLSTHNCWDPESPWNLVSGPLSNTLLLLPLSYSCSGHFTMRAFLFFYNKDTLFGTFLQWGHSFDLNVIPSTTIWSVFEFSDPKICRRSSLPSRTMLFKSCKSGHLGVLLL